MFNIKASVCFLLISAAWTADAVPMLKAQAEIIADGELKAKVLAGAKGIPAPTPEVRTYVITRGSETRTVKWYDVADLWRLRAFAGEWKDKKGNTMRLSRIKSLIPALPNGKGEKEKIESALDEMEKKFTAADIEKWKLAWGADEDGKVVEVKGKFYYLEFRFAENIRASDRIKLIKDFEKSVASKTYGASGAISAMKWWASENEHYRFLVDLDKAKGEKFIADVMKLMNAMRKSYEFYVPSQKEVGKCTVRVFKTLSGYRDYRISTGDEDNSTCGLWDPRREELLISAEDRIAAQNTMRHEAFHQYLYFATGNGNHAMWFNEGHATFFENVKYNPAKDTVNVLDEGNRANWVSRNLVYCANSIKDIIRMSYEQFYSGNQQAHYCTAWALVYFLEKGAYASDDFAEYRTIIPKYLELTSSGVGSAEATEKAWSVVRSRNLAEDFIRFWKELRKSARNAR